jgi:two-component system sensor histidine kinase HydH
MDERGKPYQYIAIRADITPRKAAEARLAQQAALARLGQMAAVVAHEVRNPLAGIKGAMQILMARRQEGDPDRLIMRDVVARIDSLGDLVNDLMVFARPHPPQPATFPLRPVVLEAVDALRRDPTASALDVTVEGEDMTLEADPQLIRAALLNLLLNAAQAMDGRGRITVSIARRGNQCAIEIVDTGPGVPPELHDRVFEPFFTTKARGGGLGLPIARRTAELHGGSLMLNLADAGGARFTLVLPCRDRPGPL